MVRWLNLLLLLLLILVGLPAYWLLFENGTGQARPRQVDMAELRALALALPGQRPTAVRYEVPARQKTPGTYLAAGSGFRTVTVGMPAWLLIVPGQGGVMIDSGMGARTAGELKVGRYDALAQARIFRALRRASLIVATQEHGDSMGGLALVAHEPLLARARLNPGQLPAAPLAGKLPWSSELGSSERGANKHLLAPALPGDRPSAIAPGIVTIPAPSHTPGSQMIFVRLANGRELLFAGDISPLDESWRAAKARARYLSYVHGAEDRLQVQAWLLTLQQLKRQSPDLIIVPGRDLDWLARADRQVMRAGLP